MMLDSSLLKLLISRQHLGIAYVITPALRQKWHCAPALRAKVTLRASISGKRLCKIRAKAYVNSRAPRQHSGNIHDAFGEVTVVRQKIRAALITPQTTNYCRPLSLIERNKGIAEYPTHKNHCINHARMISSRSWWMRELWQNAPTTHNKNHCISRIMLEWTPVVMLGRLRITASIYNIFVVTEIAKMVFPRK